jgi:hypothetical protein
MQNRDRVCTAKRAPVVMVLLLSLGGCVSHNWAPGPGMNAGDFGPARARCSLLARHSGSGFSAYGSASYVAGAALGHAIGESIRANQDFNDCMEATGWRIADQPPAAARQDPRVAQLSDIKAQGKTCVGAVRDKPIYAPLQSHLSNLDTGRFAMAQIADDRVPTDAEAQLLVAYLDDAAPCRDKFVAGVSELAPAAQPVLAQVRSDFQGMALLLIKRQLTWGQAAQRQQQIEDAAVAKLRRSADAAPMAPPATASAPAYPPSPVPTAVASPETAGQTVLVPVTINNPYHEHWTGGGSR